MITLIDTMGRKSRNAGKKKTRVQPGKLATEYSESDREVRDVIVKNRYTGLKVGYNPNRCNQEELERVKLYYILNCPDII